MLFNPPNRRLQMKKEGHKIKLLEYLANPENEFLPRYKLASDVLGIAQNTF